MGSNKPESVYIRRAWRESAKGHYKQAVAKVMDKYRKVKNIDPKELALLAEELKGHWNRISKHLNSPQPRKKTSNKKKK